MATNSTIEWTDATWNPVTGCARMSRGCDNCYAARMAVRLDNMGQPNYKGLTSLNAKGDRHFNGKINLVESALTLPLRWKKPRSVFVNSMSDLFHRDVPVEFIKRVFSIMNQAKQHNFQVLTKRSTRLLELAPELDWGITSGWESASKTKPSFRALPTLLQRRQESNGSHWSRCWGRCRSWALRALIGLLSVARAAMGPA